MTIVSMRAPRPVLASILPMFGSNHPTIDQRLCDAMFAIAIAGRGNSPKSLWMKASMRVVDELEAAVRHRCKPANRAWRWTPSHGFVAKLTLGIHVGNRVG